MRRKVIQIAESTQLISLPRKWAIRYNVKKGDELDLEEQGNKVIISTTNDTESKRCIIDVTGQLKLKRRSLCAAYLKGYDEIEIKYDTPEYIQVIQSVLPEFTGYDIVKQDKKSCVIKQISKPTADEFNNVFNRLFLLLHDTLGTIIDGLKKNDVEQLKSIQFRESSINKFSNFCRRIVNKGGYAIPEQTTSLYFILMSLEFLGDEYKELSKHLLNDPKVDKRLIAALDETNILFENVFKVFKTKNKELAVQNAIHYDTLCAQVENTFTQLKTDHIGYHHISRILQIIIQMQEAMLLMLI